MKTTTDKNSGQVSLVWTNLNTPALPGLDRNLPVELLGLAEELLEGARAHELGDEDNLRKTKEELLEGKLLDDSVSSSVGCLVCFVGLLVCLS